MKSQNKLSPDALALLVQYLTDNSKEDEVEFNGRPYPIALLKIIRDSAKRELTPKIREDIASNIEFKARCWELAIRTPIEKGQSFFQLSIKIGEFLLANPGAIEYEPKKKG
jgi:hypothetical protein